MGIARNNGLSLHGRVPTGWQTARRFRKSLQGSWSRRLAMPVIKALLLLIILIWMRTFGSGAAPLSSPAPNRRMRRPLFCAAALIRWRMAALRYRITTIPQSVSADSSASNLPLSPADREIIHELLDLRDLGRRLFHRRAQQPGRGS